MLKLTRNLIDFELFKDDEDIMAKKMDKQKLTTEEITKIFDDDLFPHLNNLQGPDNESVDERNIRLVMAKANLLAIMTARFLEYLAGFRDYDDRDSWSKKRSEGAGRMMEPLLRNAWRKTLRLVQTSILKTSGTIKTWESVISKLQSGHITSTFRDSFITSNWGVKNTQMKNNIAQTLVRDSIVSTFAHINTVDVGISRTDRQQSLRLVQNTQWGFICPISSPEGENCGLIKNFSLTTKVSIGRSDTDIIRRLIGDKGFKWKERVFIKYEHKGDRNDYLIVNGKFIGWCNGEKTRNYLIKLRRRGELCFDMSVIKEGDWLYVDASPSRLIRPLLIVNPKSQNINEYRSGADIKYLMIDVPLNKNPNDTLRNKSNYQMLINGGIEFISPWEQEYLKIATTVDKIKERLDLIADANKALLDAVSLKLKIENGELLKDEDMEITLEDAENIIKNAKDEVEKLKRKREYTHCEIDPLAIIGVAASLMPWPNHNQAPRNTYQVSMGKQALGIFHNNHLNRMGDGKTKILVFPTRPMVETDMYSILGLDDRGPGENVVVAFLAYPYTEEDAFIYKKEFLDNGGMRSYKYFTYKTTINENSGIINESLELPNVPNGTHIDRYKYIHKDGPMAGLPKIGAPLRSGDCVIGKVQRATGQPDRNESSILRIGDDGVVEKVLVTTNNKKMTVIVKLRIMRIPIEGDKFAPRNAQKGTIGLVMSDIDLPFDKNGITPDMIINPHSIPSRMTQSYPQELHSGKAAAMKGVHVNSGAHHPYEMNKYRKSLKQYGMNEFAYEVMRSGTSGLLLEAPIYVGPIFFQQLRHHVEDKVQARGKGQRNPTTRQPPKGRGNRGGLRFGEMERDAAISHGASSFLRERLMLVSDEYKTVFCKTCGTFAVNDPNTNSYRKCSLCKSDQNFGHCTIPYAYKLLIHLLAAPGINLRPELITSDEYSDKILHQKGGITGSNFEDIILEEEQDEQEEIEEDEQQEHLLDEYAEW